MIETHAFGDFVPNPTNYIILGTFTGRQALKKGIANDPAYDWFYATKQNQFWPILERVYKVELRNKRARAALLTYLRIGLADTIYQCERKQGTNLDVNLTKMVYNKEGIINILRAQPVTSILFTSRFAENIYRRQFHTAIELFPNIKLMSLPSPSPRYCALSKAEKTDRYRALLPAVDDGGGIRNYLSERGLYTPLLPLIENIENNS